MNELVKLIREAKKEVERLESQYVEETDPCINENCTFYNKGCTLNCSWTTIVEECRDYRI